MEYLIQILPHYMEILPSSYRYLFSNDVKIEKSFWMQIEASIEAFAKLSFFSLKTWKETPLKRNL